MRTLARWLLASAFLLVFTVAILEIACFAAYWIVEGKRFSYAKFAERRAEVIETYSIPEGEVESPDPDAGDVAPDVSEMLHPFLSYVRNPAAPGAQSRPLGPINEYGWRGEGKPFHTADDEATIVIVGGSVAYRNWPSRQTLIDEIKALPQFRDKRIFYETLASPGYKQPSQLASVVYYLALGGKIDILINLDGVNEVQYVRGTNYHPAYPRRWVALMKDVSSLETLEVFGRAHVLKDLRLQVSRTASKAGFSVTANVFWHFLDRLLRSELDRLSLAAEGLAAAGELDRDGKLSNLPEWRSGPSFEGGLDERVGLVVNVWANSSVALQHLADGFGFYYFHFLQPSQYLAGSKTFTDAELERAVNPDAGRQVSQWYPRLLELGDALRERGVEFYSLTHVFEDVLEPTYRDKCCHLNQRGKDIVAQRMGQIIVESIESSPSARSFDRAPQLKIELPPVVDSQGEG